jgi:hypothetical protein
MIGDVTVTKLNPTPPSIPPPLKTGTDSPVIAFADAYTFPKGQSFVPQPKIRVNLVANPLDRDRAGSAQLSVGFDATGSWLQLADGLPLIQISSTPNLTWAALARSPSGPGLEVLQSNTIPTVQSGTGVQLYFQGANPFEELYAITRISHMMAFDCGGFDLPAPGK